MITLALTLALALPPALPKSSSPGPTLPPVQGLMKPIPMSADVKEYVRWSLKEMGQAVVVVEGEMGLALPRAHPGIRLFDGGLTLFQPKLPSPADIPTAPWLDMSTVGAPGNSAGKIYPIGWGY